MERLYNGYEKFNKVLGEYAIYLRKSRTDSEAEARGEGETLARHEKILLNLSERMGIKIGKIYREIVSGDTIEERPEMQKVLSDVKKGMWKGILVVEVERLARGDTEDQGTVAKAFKISNTKIITPLKVYDPNDEFDEEYFEFGLFMSRREYKAINRRLQRGRISSIDEGKYVGSVAPYGYERAKISGEKGYTLKKNSEANLVKIIYDLYAYEDISLHEVVRRINTMGIKPRKNDEWTVASVKEILANPVYIGKIKWNSRRVVKVYKNEKLVKTRPRSDDYILKDGLHEPIIDEKTWKIVEAKRSLNKPPIPRTNTVQNPLCGLVYCAKCGRKMKRRPYTDKSKEPTLYCENTKCDNISSKLYYVEEKVIEGLKKWLEQYSFDFKEHMEKLNHNKIEAIEETILSLEAEARKENDKLLSIFNFLEDGTYTKEMFKARSEAVSQNVARINNSIEEYKIRLEQEKTVDKEKEILVPKIANLLDVYDLLQTPEEKNDLLKSVLTQVTYLKTEKAIKKNSDPTNFIINLYPKIDKVVI
ncbi:MAG: recombinase family protein [Clostridia bacterium]|nr:recombinase family protein [Clostridia bacterium]